MQNVYSMGEKINIKTASCEERVFESTSVQWQIWVSNPWNAAVFRITESVPIRKRLEDMEFISV